MSARSNITLLAPLAIAVGLCTMNQAQAAQATAAGAQDPANEVERSLRSRHAESGSAQGSWTEPSALPGRAQGHLYSAVGEVQYLLDADLTRYVFVTGDPQGTAYGAIDGLLTAEAPSPGIVPNDLAVIGGWSRVPGEAGQFQAQIMQVNSITGVPVAVVGQMNGAFYGSTAQAATAAPRRQRQAPDQQDPDVLGGRDDGPPATLSSVLRADAVAVRARAHDIQPPEGPAAQAAVRSGRKISNAVAVRAKELTPIIDPPPPPGNGGSTLPDRQRRDTNGNVHASRNGFTPKVSAKRIHGNAQALRERGQVVLIDLPPDVVEADPTAPDVLGGTVHGSTAASSGANVANAAAAGEYELDVREPELFFAMWGISSN